MKKMLKMFVLSLMITFTSFAQVTGTLTADGTWNSWIVGAKAGILHTQGTKTFKKNRNDVNINYNNTSKVIDNYGYLNYAFQPTKNLGTIYVNFNVHVTNTLTTTNPTSYTLYYVMAVVNGVDTGLTWKVINNSELQNLTITIPTTVDSLKTIKLIYIPIGNNISYTDTNNLETVTFTDPTITVGVGVAEYSKNNAKLSIFPNPSNGDVSIKFETTKNKATIEVFDIQGRLVHENTEEREVGVNTTKLNLEGLSAGIYIVRVENSTFKITVIK